MTNIGYMRVSTDDQDLSLQRSALVKAGVAESDIYQDTISGSKISRSGLDACLERLQEGDTLVVWKLDRLGRGTVHLMTLVDTLVHKGIGFKSITESWDTSTPIGKAMFRIGCVFAELERDNIRQRTKAGMEEARARGAQIGRLPRVVYDKKEVAAMLSKATVRETAEQTGLSVSTVARISASLRDSK